VAQVRRRDRYIALDARLAAALQANRLAHQMKLRRDRERLDALGARASRACLALLDRRWSALERSAELLEALSYHGVLARGFALVRDEAGRPLRLASAIVSGQRLELEFADGKVAAVAGDARALLQGAPVRRPRRRTLVAAGQGDLF
jgi:exodeoxyribonuclease VII large subunit